MDIERNLSIVRERIAAAARAAGREPESIRLVAVTKTFPAESGAAAFRAGVFDLGENRVEEARDKVPAVSEILGGSTGPRWHLIGHLQRRKARDAVQLFDLIQSVDTVRVAQALNRRAADIGKFIPVLLQVNVARDPDKFGFIPDPRDAFYASVAEILALPALQVRGLMTIGALVPDAEQARPFFRDLRELRDELAARFPAVDWSELSMGMTDDFPVAISEGATIIRVGRAIFGERKE